MHTFTVNSAFLSLFIAVATASPLPSPVNAALLPRQSTQSCVDDYPLTAGAAASGSNENSTTSSTSECGLLGCTSSGSAASEDDTSTSSSSTDIIEVTLWRLLLLLREESRRRGGGGYAVHETGVRRKLARANEVERHQHLVLCHENPIARGTPTIAASCHVLHGIVKRSYEIPDFAAFPVAVVGRPEDAFDADAVHGCSCSRGREPSPAFDEAVGDLLDASSSVSDTVGEGVCAGPLHHPSRVTVAFGKQRRLGLRMFIGAVAPHLPGLVSREVVVITSLAVRSCSRKSSFPGSQSRLDAADYLLRPRSLRVVLLVVVVVVVAVVRRVVVVVELAARQLVWNRMLEILNVSPGRRGGGGRLTDGVDFKARFFARESRGRQRRGSRKYRVDCHHFRMHGERSVGLLAAATSFERRERLRARVALLSMLFLSLLFLQLLLEIGNGRTIQGTLRNAAMLQCSAIEARTVVIETLSGNLASANDDAAMAIVERGLRSLLEALSEVVVGLHFVRTSIESFDESWSSMWKL
ncbi:hypothetical protein KC335_g178 [Hortaea werneckii]|nr:hypothetical protein KC335_g178 [Hortaea werneckii]